MKRFLSPEIELWKDDPTLLDPRWRVFGTAGKEPGEGAGHHEGRNEGVGQGGSEGCPCLTRVVPFEPQRLQKFARGGEG